MVVPFEKFNCDVNCLGNHELDFGYKEAVNLMQKTSSPWLMTNLLEKKSGNPICKCKESYVLEKYGFKFGFLGFAEKPWLDCLSPEIDVDKLTYIDYNESLREHSKKLRDQGCDLVIALNHMRLPEDLCMAQENDHTVVDIAFGGHDHGYHRSLNEKTSVFVQKSGTDFECLTNLTVLFGVEKEDCESYKTEFATKAKEVEAKNKLLKPSEEIEFFYSAVTKRMFISERVNVT